MKHDVPAHLLTCEDVPEPPETMSQKDGARWVVGVIGAGDDCRTKLKAVKDIVE